MPREGEIRDDRREKEKAGERFMGNLLITRTDVQ
jgi:hypothetical protein